MQDALVKGLNNIINQTLNQTIQGKIGEDIINSYGAAIKKLAYEKGNKKKVNIGFAKLKLEANHEMEMDLLDEFVEVYNHGGLDTDVFSPTERLVEIFVERLAETDILNIQEEVAAGLLTCLFTAILVFIKKKIKDGKEVEVEIPHVGNVVFIEYDGGIVATLRASTDFVKVVG